LNAAGTIVNYGVSASPEITINTGGFFSTGRCKFYGLSLFSELGYESAAIGLERLAKLIGSGHITPLIDNVRPWEQIEQAALDLIDRKYFGKIVLTV
jgi:NADPH:quinone reductase-like Zn-dependent oxidoreductase